MLSSSVPKKDKAKNVKKRTRAVWRALVKFSKLKIPYQYKPENAASEIVRLILSFFNQSLFLTAQIFIKYLWDCKVRQILPRLPLLKNIAISEASLIVKINNRMKDLLINSGLNNEFLAEILRAENLQG
jgi:hypothetical protein